MSIRRIFALAISPLSFGVSEAQSFLYRETGGVGYVSVSSRGDHIVGAELGWGKTRSKSNVFIWSLNSGLQFLSGNRASYFGDGNNAKVVVDSSGQLILAPYSTPVAFPSNSDPYDRTQTSRWVKGQGWFPLGDESGNLIGGSHNGYQNMVISWPAGISDDGSTELHQTYWLPEGRNRGFLIKGGQRSVLPDSRYMNILRMSGNGRVVYGLIIGAGTTRMFRWLDGGAREELPSPIPNTSALVLNSDGSIVAGSQDLHTFAFYTDQLGTTLLRHPTDQAIEVSGVSDNGLLIGGGWNGENPFVYSRATGFITLRAFLLGKGVNVPANLRLARPFAISRDGSTIAGISYNPSAPSKEFLYVARFNPM